ncbi:MAG: hypothetical protein U0228_15240 [Myxococcaceae bacterium]
MMRWLTILAVLAVAQAPTLAQRKRFAEQHRTKFVFDWSKDGMDCVKATAPAALRCDTPVWLCPRAMGGGMCNGSFFEARGLTFQLHEPTTAEVDATPLPELTLEEESGDDCPECECTDDEGLSFGPGVSEKDQERARLEFAKERQRAHETCVREAAKRQKAERTIRRCTLLMVDPCRQEAFLRCIGKNGGESAPPLNRTLVFSFAPKPDGGMPAGGEWEASDSD